MNNTRNHRPIPRAAAVFALVAALVLAAPAALAERSDSFGDYTVHYNALTTDLIDPTIARSYGIVRSKSRALVNVAVLKKVMGTSGKPVRATVEATATNLSNQLKTIDMRELYEGGTDAESAGAIYYIGELPVANNETLDIRIVVTPEGSDMTHTTTFRQEFYTQ